MDLFEEARAAGAVAEAAKSTTPWRPRLAMMSRSVNMSIEAHGNSHAMHRTGWILSGIVIAFMAADAGQF